MKDILKIPDIPTLYPEKEDYHTARIASISISDMSRQSRNVVFLAK